MAPLHLGVYGLKEETVTVPAGALLGTNRISQRVVPAIGDVRGFAQQRNTADLLK